MLLPFTAANVLPAVVAYLLAFVVSCVSQLLGVIF